MTTASPIDIATIADVCDVGDSMEERPLFPQPVPALCDLTDDLILSLSYVFALWGQLRSPVHVPSWLVILAQAGIQACYIGASRPSKHDREPKVKQTNHPLWEAPVEVRKFFDIANTIIRAIL